MPDRSSAEAMKEFCLRALEYIDEARRLRDVTPRFVDTDPWSAEWTDVANEHQVACADLRTAEHRLRSWLDESGAGARYGQPEGVSSALREIRLALLQREGYIFAEPDRLPGLKERIESLRETAIDISSTRDATDKVADLIRRGFRRVTVRELCAKARRIGESVGAGRSAQVAERALKKRIILDRDFVGKDLWVIWNPDYLDTLERGTKSPHSGRSRDNGADGR
jgi:hypothetical protein